MKLPVVGKAHQAQAGNAFYWFIYGSSLDRSAFAEWAQEHGYRLPDFTSGVIARLPDYRLCFDVESRFWGGAVASLVAAPGRSVEGVALPLPGEAQGLVDHKEGAISGLYEPMTVAVTPLEGGPNVSAIAYRAATGRRLPVEPPPSRRYVETVLRGARDWKLSPAYQASLEALLR